MTNTGLAARGYSLPQFPPFLFILHSFMGMYSQIDKSTVYGVFASVCTPVYMHVCDCSSKNDFSHFYGIKKHGNNKIGNFLIIGKEAYFKYK